MRNISAEEKIRKASSLSLVGFTMFFSCAAGSIAAAQAQTSFSRLVGEGEKSDGSLLHLESSEGTLSGMTTLNRSDTLRWPEFRLFRFLRSAFHIYRKRDERGDRFKRGNHSRFRTQDLGGGCTCGRIPNLAKAKRSNEICRALPHVEFRPFRAQRRGGTGLPLPAHPHPYPPGFAGPLADPRAAHRIAAAAGIVAP